LASAAGTATSNAAVGGGQRTPHDLRFAPLRRKRLIHRIPRSQRYELTDHGRRTAVFFTKTYTRIVDPSLTELDPTLPTDIAARSAHSSRSCPEPRSTRVRGPDLR
jgi:hypothetical protein